MAQVQIRRGTDDPVDSRHLAIDDSPANESKSSAVSWPAIAAGAFATAAFSLILLSLGAGAGLSSLSPWSNSGVSASTVGKGALLWLVVIEIVSAALGGYLAGRLRTKWVDVHSDEVYFRDTAHGLLAWCVALVITAAFLTSAAARMVGADSRTPAPSRSESVADDANRYYVDSLFRSGQAPTPNDAAIRSEVSAIFAHALASKEFSDEDKSHVAALVSARTGVSRAEAEKRVNDVFERDREAADAARKAVAHSLYWLFVALLLGAFSASFAATMGGRQRDHIHAV
jgi:hypothetical protein